MLGGQGIDAWWTSVQHFDPIAVGMNCATGPEFMADHIRQLSSLATCAVSVYPNAGLPDENGDYPETPEMLADKLARFVEEGWVNLVGGCCGTTPEHIRAIAKLAEGRTPRRPAKPDGFSLSGIERTVLDPDTRPLLVGERTNVIGSLRFKRLVAQGKWEDAAEIGRAQVKRGAQIVDVCLSHPDRDELADVADFYPRLTRLVKAPLMIDATDPAVLEAALKQSQGKAVINSINLEDGEERLELVAPLLRKYGAAVVVGTIDENHVFPEDIIVEEKELLVAMHFTVAAPTAADWIGCFHRREVMTGRHSTRLHLFAAEMAKHFCETLCEKRWPSEVAINKLCCALMVTHEMDTVFDNA